MSILSVRWTGRLLPLLVAAWAAGATPLVAQQATLVPGGRLVVAEESGHSVEAEQPELIVAAVEQVVTAARDPSMWATPVATPAP